MSMFKITKLKPVVDFICPTAVTTEEYRKSDDLSPNVDYWVIGEVLAEPTIGRSLMVKRYIRNGIEVPGLFSTSLVTEITENGFKTMNSEYKIEKVNP